MNFIKNNINDFKKDLSKLISFETWLSSSEYPNQKIKDALSFMEEIAKRDGIKSYIDDEGYYGYIEIGSGEELIGILTHIDVVPPGDLGKWNTPPFVLTEKNGKLFGRGTSDDKGPLMLLYYLLKELKDEKLNKRIRLIFPTNEESSWKGVSKYNELEEKPIFGITPDSSFPVTFLEREVLQVELSSKGTGSWSIKSGVAANVVPAEAMYINGDNKIISKGKSVHAMNPQLGINAVYKLLEEVKGLDHPLVNFINKELNGEYHGQTIFNKLIEDDYAKITVNLGIVDINKDNSKIIVDMRIPITSSAKEVEEVFKQKSKQYGFNYKGGKQHAKVYIPEDNWVIKDLVDSYTEVIGKKLKPQASGGGTYAKAMNNVVAYGPLMPWAKHTEHQYNEHIDIEDYIKAYDIYKNLFTKWINKDRKENI